MKKLIIFTRLYLSLGVTLSGLLTYIIAKGTITTDAIVPVFAVLLLSLGTSALNQYQEREYDANMPRTKNRPLVTGEISIFNGLLISLSLIIVSIVLIMMSLGMTGFNLFVFTILLYNGLYTPMKRWSAFAVIPGSLLGVVAPAIGWIAAGYSLFEVGFIALAILYFIWQVPHFWLLVVMYHEDYVNAGYPTVVEIFGKVSLHRITFIWMILTFLSAVFVVAIFEFTFTFNYILFALFFAHVMYRAIKFMNTPLEYLIAKKTFIHLNAFVLLTVLLVTIDRSFN